MRIIRVKIIIIVILMGSSDDIGNKKGLMIILGKEL